MLYKKLIYFVITIAFIHAISSRPLKILHLSFHQGCIKDFEYVAQQLDLDLTSIHLPDQPQGWFDGVTKGSAIFSIGHGRAKNIWKLHKDYFNEFDAVITSDTAPLARIFLQNNWKKPLIMWICNRFDYCDHATRDCHFPDPEYYQLINEARHKKNVRIIAYTPFEHYYARTKGVDTGSLTIKPCAMPNNTISESQVPATINKQETFFIPPYHNETIYCNLADRCAKLGIPVYHGRYNGPGDLKDFKGIIHLPYAWSNLALFENIQNGVPYFVPSRKFLKELKPLGNYWFQDDSHLHVLELSEWYAPEYKDLFIYFDSWQDLIDKTKHMDYLKVKEQTLAIAHKHHDTMLERWHIVFDELSKIN